MESEAITYLIIGVILGIIIGVIATNIMSPKTRKYNIAKQELDEAKRELANQKQVIVKHFSHSAEILDNMAKDFRRLYQHMAENSSNLLSEEDIKNSVYNSPALEITETSPVEIQEKKPEPPKDYSGNPSGLLKTEENK